MTHGSSLLVALGNNIRTHRKRLGLTQEELAGRSKLHRTYIADVERGGRNVSILNIAKIALSLQLNIAELCAGIDEQTQPQSGLCPRR